jgi:hypothetical protein
MAPRAETDLARVRGSHQSQAPSGTFPVPLGIWHPCTLLEALTEHTY